MIRLGLRLAVTGGREAIGRLALIATAVAVGVALLLTTLATTNALDAQNDRHAWLETGYPGAEAAGDPASTGGSTAADPLWWRLRPDYFQGREIGRVDVAATGPDAPLPPGIPALPGPGEYYVSPALADLLRATPAAQLADRFPGEAIGRIGPDALPAPDSLMVIVGRDVADLSRQAGARQVTAISTTPPDECTGECAPGVGTNANGMTLILSVVAAALLFPVLIFIGGATRLSAARREQRFAAMRLVGGTPRQISVLATVESAVAAVAGVAAGFGLFAALRPTIAGIPFTGDPFFPDDLSLGLRNVLLVALGIPLAAALAARIALRRVTISPLGVARRVTPPPPRAWRVVPLLAGLAELGYLAFASDIGESGNSNTQATAYLAGALLVMGGLVVAGPWLTMLGSRLMARRAGRPAGLIAARRLGDDPRAAFRAISGLVIAVFVGTCTVAVISTVVAYNSGDAGDTTTSTGTLVHGLADGLPSSPPVAPPSEGDLDELVAVPGVAGITTIHVRSDSGDDGLRQAWFYVSCEQLARTPALGRCPDGAATVEIVPHFGSAVIETTPSMADTTWTGADLGVDELTTMPVDTIVVGTDGSAAAVESARTVLGDLYPAAFPPQTINELTAHGTQQLDSFRQLANVVLLTSLPIAGCSLAVNIAGGLADRRRPFSLLRLTGVPLALLRRVVTLEAAVPLLIGTVVSAGAGLASAALFIRAQTEYTLLAPGVGYWLLVAGGMVASLAIIASTLPLLARTTGPDAVRNE